MRALAFAVLAACKSHSAPPTTAPGSAAITPASLPAAAARPTAPASPALPADAAAPAIAPQPLTLGDATAHLPRLDGDTMIPAKTTADGLQVHATWCLAGTGADAVAESLGKTMAAAGYTNLSTRGDADKAGVSGERDGYRLSYVVSASSATSCRAPGHYFASATLFRAR